MTLLTWSADGVAIAALIVNWFLIRVCRNQLNLTRHMLDTWEPRKGRNE